MTLDSYLRHHNLTPSEFARRASVSPSTIIRLIAGQREPGLALMRTIFDATGGEVAPNDFLSVPTASRCVPADGDTGAHS